MSIEVIHDEGYPHQHKGQEEDGVEVPWSSIKQETLRNLIAEFVTREWPDTEYTLETKIDQVMTQLRAGQAKIVFDMVAMTCNIVPSK